MSLIKVSQIMERIKKNPILSSGLDIHYDQDGILITVEDPVPLSIGQAQRVVEWMAEVIGGEVKWENSEKAKVVRAKAAPKPKENALITEPVDWSDVADTTAVYADYEGFDVIPVYIYRAAQKQSLYSECEYEFGGDRMDTPRSADQVEDHVKFMIFEDRFFGGLTNAQLRYKYHLLPAAISPIIKSVSAAVGRPEGYRPQFAVKKAKPAVTAPKKEEPKAEPKQEKLDTGPQKVKGSINAESATTNMVWAGAESSKIQRLTSSQLDTLKQQDRARALAGLSRIKIRLRHCVACKQLFETSAAYNCGCNVVQRREFMLEDQTGVSL